ncbi:cardiolipin synthase, partial [Enterococcus faecium]
LIEVIKLGEDLIHFQYYSYRSDTVGEEVREAMTEAARRGVKVRVLLDAWGSTLVSSSFFQNLKKAGGEVAFFFPQFV